MKFSADNAIHTTTVVMVLSFFLPGSNSIPVCSSTRQEMPDDFDIFAPGCHHPHHSNAIRKYYVRLPGQIAVSIENISRIMASLSSRSKEEQEFLLDVSMRSEVFSPCSTEIADLKQHLNSLNPEQIVYNLAEIETVHVKWTIALMCHTVYLHHAKRNAECSHDTLQALAIANDNIITTSRRLMCTFAPRRLPGDLRAKIESHPAYEVPHNSYRREVDNYIILRSFKNLLKEAKRFLQEAMEGYTTSLL